MVVSFDRRNFVYEFSNFKSPPSISVKKQSSLSDTPMPCVTPCVPPYEGLNVPTITLSTSPSTPSSISNIPPSPIYPNHNSSPLTTTNNFLQRKQLLNTSQHLRDDSGIFNSSSFSARKSSDASNRSRGDSGISPDSTTTGLSPSIGNLQKEHYDETKIPVVSPNILSDFSMDDQYKFRERSHAFSHAKPRFSTSEHIIITICVTGNDFICEPGPSRNACGASLDKDNEIEDFKQSSKG